MLYISIGYYLIMFFSPGDQSAEGGLKHVAKVDRRSVGYFLLERHCGFDIEFDCLLTFRNTDHHLEHHFILFYSQV